MGKDFTKIVLLLDRSGSMSSVKGDVVGGYATFVKEQKAAGENADLTLVQFDSGEIETVWESVPIAEVKEKFDFNPRGATPLLDALGETIQSTGRALEAIPEATRPDKVVFVVITDGQENASKEFTKAQIKGMIEHQTNTYNWQFLYLGANQDAFAESGAIGMAAATTANFAPRNTAKSFGIGGQNVAAYRSTGLASSLAYSAVQRAELENEGSEGGVAPAKRSSPTSPHPPRVTPTLASRIDWRKPRK